MNRRGRAPGVDDAGSAAVWVISCCALVLVAAYAAVLRADAVLLRHRTESAADLAALAAARRIGVADDGCTVAAQVAVANTVTLRSCAATVALDGRSGEVEVAVVLAARLPIVGVRDVVAHARAGRVPVPP